MLISDWSSDVFSSDLSRSCKGTGMAIPPAALAAMAQFPAAAHDRGSMFTTVAHYTDPIEAHLARGRLLSEGIDAHLGDEHLAMEIGRASCRERVCPYVSISVVSVSLKKKHQNKKTL